MEYCITGSAALSDTLGDLVIYRKLEPADDRLPGLRTLWRDLGWDRYRVPRKAEPEYAAVVARILQSARRLDSPGGEIRQVIYLGDTHMNDGTAFANICSAGGWPGLAFIADEKPAEPPATRLEGRIFLANRWSAIDAFIDYVISKGFTLDESLVCVIDMDKTAIGARGRNGGAIDNARVQAVHATVASVLGERFNPGAFRHAYDTLNQPRYHPFTGDNQDILAYLCLIISGGLIPMEKLLIGQEDGSIPSFDHFIRSLECRREELMAAGLLSIHEEVYDAWDAGDPTPFKAFRYQEYVFTSGSFDPHPPAGPIEKEFDSRILITEEVRAVAERTGRQGVLLFGLSDKPDEATFPPSAGPGTGGEPLHRCRTLSVGAVTQG